MVKTDNFVYTVEYIIIWGRLLAGNITCGYLLTPWSRVLLEKLSGSQLVKKFPAFYWIRTFIAALASARHLSPSWTTTIQSMPHIPLPEYPFSNYPSMYAWSSKLPLALSFPHQKPVHASPQPHTCYMSRPSNFSWFVHRDNTWWAVQIIKLLIT